MLVEDIIEEVKVVSEEEQGQDIQGQEPQVTSPHWTRWRRWQPCRWSRASQMRKTPKPRPTRPLSTTAQAEVEKTSEALGTGGGNSLGAAF